MMDILEAFGPKTNHVMLSPKALHCDNHSVSLPRPKFVSGVRLGREFLTERLP
jgi:hypothetical protein